MTSKENKHGIGEAFVVRENIWRDINATLDDFKLKGSHALSKGALTVLLKVVLHKLPLLKAFSALNALYLQGCFGDYDFEVESIIGVDLRQPHLYHVKWAAWPIEFSSWEPYESVCHCTAELIAFQKWSQGLTSSPYLEEDKRNCPCNLTNLDHLIDILCANNPNLCKNLSLNVLESAILQVLEPSKIDSRKRKSSSCQPVPPRKSDDFSSHISLGAGVIAPVPKQRLQSQSMNRGAYRPPINKDRQLLVRSVSRLHSMEHVMASLMASLMKRLQAWQVELNSAWGTGSRIWVENCVDQEGPPLNFQPIRDYVYHSSAAPHDVAEPPPIFCTCINGSECHKRCKNDCCMSIHSATVPYNKSGLLSDKHASNAIFECNSRCACDASCPYRVVQKGSAHHLLTIFRTVNRGWGVKTRRKILRGRFLCEYIGEVVSNEVAEARGLLDDKDGATYLFDLDFDSEPLFAVDARYKANIARFINHSCDPNCMTMCVFIDNLNPKLPRLALFAKRDIEVGEELTFDYYMTGEMNGERSGDLENNAVANAHLATPAAANPPVTPSRQVRRDCACQSANCRGFIYV